MYVPEPERLVPVSPGDRLVPVDGNEVLLPWHGVIMSNERYLRMLTDE